MNALAHLLGLLLALGGFAGLAMAMARQQEDTLGRELGRKATRTLRTLGWLLIVACLWLCIATWGWGLGLVIASGHTSAGAALVFCTLIALDRRRVARAPAKPDRAASAASTARARGAAPASAARLSPDAGPAAPRPAPAAEDRPARPLAMAEHHALAADAAPPGTATAAAGLAASGQAS